MKIGITVGVVIAVLALVAGFVPIIEVSYTETVQYQNTETYYENEPYEDTETYYENEPYEAIEIYYETELQEVTEPLEYQFLGWGFGGYENLDGNYVFGPHYKLMNRGEVAGHFTIRLVLYTIEKDKYLDLVWKYPHGLPEEVIETNFKKLVIEEVLYLEPRETGEVAWSWEELGIDSAKIEYDGRWEVLPEEVRRVKPVQVEKERTVTKYRQVEKQRTVTKYRQVEKQRTVTKQRPETSYKKVTLLDYLLHY